MRVPLLGGAYKQPNLIAQAQRCVNLYPETNPPQAQAPVNVTHYPRPGLTPLGTPPAAGRGRCLYRATDGSLYVVVDQTIYHVHESDFTYHEVGQLRDPRTTPVSMCDNGNSILIVDGTTDAFEIDMATGAGHPFTQVGDPNFLGADRVDFLDGFLVLNEPSSPNWYSTDAYSLVFNALSFGTKTAWPDDIQVVAVIEREAWLLGTEKSEIWFNAGSSPFAFQPQPGKIIPHGCIAKYSVATQDVNLYWLSQSREGSRLIMKNENRMAVRISTHAIEKELLTYPRVDDAIGTCYQIGGHSFYKLSFPTADKTWVYDEATKEWHEDLWTDFNGVLRRSRAAFHATAYGLNLALDWASGALYKVDPTNFTDAGNPMVCIRSMPHILDDKEFNPITTWKLIADMDVGNGEGLFNTPTQLTPWSLGFSSGFGPITLTTPPQVTLRMSRTRGRTWDVGIPVQSMGEQGDYSFIPTWNRLGLARDAIFELSWSTPMSTAINGVWLTSEESEANT